jgi:hypothetical protein
VAGEVEGFSERKSPSFSAGVQAHSPKKIGSLDPQDSASFEFLSSSEQTAGDEEGYLLRHVLDRTTSRRIVIHALFFKVAGEHRARPILHGKSNQHPVAMASLATDQATKTAIDQKKSGLLRPLSKCRQKQNTQRQLSEAKRFIKTTHVRVRRDFSTVRLPIKRRL